MPPPLASRVVRMLAILLIGLVSGALIEEYFFLDVILRGFPAEQWLLAHSRFAMLHPYSLIPAAVLGLLLIFLTFAVDRDIRSPRAIATWGAAAAGVVIGGITALIMMPMNNEIAGWVTTGPPPNLTEVQEEWIRLQAVRAVLSTTGFLLLILSTQLRGKDGRL
ncbi:MAG: DUF1772 domain-containing protein [Gemmatimonadetes bacterium]|nr:DUF1772 domain-containing protein [Gemmatimonadota bacterium]